MLRVFCIDDWRFHHLHGHGTPNSTVNIMCSSVRVRTRARHHCFYANRLGCVSLVPCVQCPCLRSASTKFAPSSCASIYGVQRVHCACTGLKTSACQRAIRYTFLRAHCISPLTTRLYIYQIEFASFFCSAWPSTISGNWSTRMHGTSTRLC